MGINGRLRSHRILLFPPHGDGSGGLSGDRATAVGSRGNLLAELGKRQAGIRGPGYGPPHHQPCGAAGHGLGGRHGSGLVVCLDEVGADAGGDQGHGGLLAVEPGRIPGGADAAVQTGPGRQLGQVLHMG